MTVMPDTPEARPIPERLVEPLRIVAGRAGMLAWFHALFQLAALCAGVWLLIVLILGSNLRVPVWASIPLTLAGWAVVLVGGYRILRQLFRRPKGMTAAALMADAAMPDSQERISSALELSQEANPAFRGSPELVAVLMRQAEHHADTMDPGQIISGKQVMRWLSAMGSVLLIWLILLLIFTPNMLLGLQRMFTPWNAAASLPGPIVEVIPGDYVLAQGAKLEVTVEIKPPGGLSLDTGKQTITNATIVQHFNSPGGGTSPDVITPMDPTGNRSFRYIFQNVQQSFTYQVLADGGKEIGQGKSDLYTVTVQTRPAVADVEVLYTFPKYTGLNPRTEHSREGTLEALVGTKAHVIIHATEPVKTARLLIGDDGTPAITTLDLTLVTAAEGAPATAQASNRETLYAADLTIDRTTQYHVNLVNAEGRDNADAQARIIRAKVDAPPTIAITLPSPKDNPQRVRPDDTVPMKFVTTDDFGVSAVDALIQVDARPVLTLPVPIANGDARITGDWDLHLPEILKASQLPAGTEPEQITYRFRATDNRDPDPQSTLSALQTLSLDKAATPLAQRLDQEAAKDMASAIAQAVSKLNSAQAKLDELKKSDQDTALTTIDRQKITDTQKDLMEAGQFLRQAADQADDTRLSNLAQQFRSVADQSVKSAEEDVVKAGLASDQPQARRASESSAAANTQDALNKLQQLANQLRNTAKDQPLAQSLERLSKDQQALAEALAKNPNDPKLLEQQQQLQAQLDKLIKDNPQLQKPAADANQPRLDDLLRKLDQIQQAQQPIGDQLTNMRNADNSGDAAKQLAQKQDQLNKDINQFSQQQTDTLKQAGAKAPEPAKLDPIPKELQDNKLAAAARDQKAAETALEQARDKLTAAQQKANQITPAHQDATDQANKDAADASKLQDEVQQLGQEIQQAKANGETIRRTDPVMQQAAKEADKIKQAAQQMAQHMPPNSAARNAAQEAIKSADAAKAATGTPDAEKAQQQLSNAGAQLRAAAQAEQNTLAAGNLQGAPDAAAKAADQAQALADRQKQLADQASALAKSQQEASDAKANAPATAEQQRQLAERIANAAQDAQNLQQQTQGPAPDLAAKAAEAQKDLQQAADAQRQAAQATRGTNPADAANKQTQAADKVAAAQEALTGQPRAQNGAPQTPAAAKPTNPSTPPSGNASATPPAGNNQNPNGQNPNASAQTPGQQPGQNPGQQPGQQAGQQPGQQAGQNPGQSPGQAQNNSPGPAATPAAPSASPLGMGGQSPANTPSNNAAAQSVQAARNSQSQALGGNATAAQQAADQLAQASRDLMNNSQAGGQQAGGQQAGGQQAGGQQAGGQQAGGQQAGGQQAGGQQAGGQQAGGQQAGGQQAGGQQAGGQQAGGQQAGGQQAGGQQAGGQQAGGQQAGGQQAGGQQAGGQQAGGQQAGGQQAGGQQAGGQQAGGQQAGGQQAGGQQAGGQQAGGQQAGGQQAGGQQAGGQQAGGQQAGGQQAGGQQAGGQQAGGQQAGGQQAGGQQAGGQQAGGQQAGGQQAGGQQAGGQQAGGQQAGGQQAGGQQAGGQQAGGQQAGGQQAGGQQAGGQQAGGQQAGGQQAGGQPGGSGGTGIKVTMNGKEYTVPKEVQDVGVAPSDWVKLSPELQDQLLHSAQQPGPPGYRDMIKNYYSRIARMQSQNGAAQ